MIILRYMFFYQCKCMFVFSISLYTWSPSPGEVWLMSVFVAVLRNFLVYLSDDTRDRQYGKKKVQLAKTPQFAICIQPILLFWYFDCDCLSYFKCADSSEICPPLLFIWGWLDINCVPNLCYSSKQTLPNPPHFQISKHILEFNDGRRSRKSSEYLS